MNLFGFSIYSTTLPIKARLINKDGVLVETFVVSTHEEWDCKRDQLILDHAGTLRITSVMAFDDCFCIYIHETNE